MRERQLVSEVIKPAEAEAQKTQILAKADAQRITLQAEAAASHNRVALDRMLIEQLPQIVREAAGGLAGANLSVINGAEGLSQVAAGLVAQGISILDTVKKGLSEEAAGRSSPARPAVRMTVSTDGTGDTDGSADGDGNGAANGKSG